MVFADNGMFFVNKFTEFVRTSGQTTQSVGDAIGRLLEKIDDWNDAWIGGYPDTPLNLFGQKFLVLQAPNATNPYGTKGITLLYDYRAKQFSSLYGWESLQGVPIRWPGWSHWRLWDRTFIGGEGKIYEFDDTVYSHAGAVQRWLVRTSHMTSGNAAQVKNFRLQLKRGLGDSNATPAKVRVRCSRDARAFGPWITRDLGMAGDRIQFKEFGHFGTATSFMWEISVTDDCRLDLIKAEIKTDPIGH